MTPDAIRAIRAKLGLSQEALATRLDVSTATVVSWEVGRRSPSHDPTAKLRALAASPEVRAVRLSESLDEAATIAEANAQADIAAGDPESAEVTLRLAEHLRRLARTHRDSDNDPVQRP